MNGNWRCSKMSSTMSAAPPLGTAGPRYHQEVMLPMAPHPSTAERFWSKVNFTDCCWLWQGALTGGGYGQYQRKPAHRWAYEFCYGKLSDDLSLDHLCRTRACVRPEHLEPVTIRENILRGVGPSAENAKKSHCTHGHLLDALNTYVARSYRNPLFIWRNCRTCNREKMRRRRAMQT